jgi:hypothetical protein
MTTIRKCRGYWPAYRAYRRLPTRFDALSGHEPMLIAGWQRALEKDVTGLNCIRLLQDWIERLTPMPN